MVATQFDVHQEDCTVLFGSNYRLSVATDSQRERKPFRYGSSDAK
jgi:hypothetical protein